MSLSVWTEAFRHTWSCPGYVHCRLSPGEKCQILHTVIRCKFDKRDDQIEVERSQNKNFRDKTLHGETTKTKHNHQFLARSESSGNKIQMKTESTVNLVPLNLHYPARRLRTNETDLSVFCQLVLEHLNSLLVFNGPFDIISLLKYVAVTFLHLIISIIEIPLDTHNK